MVKIAHTLLFCMRILLKFWDDATLTVFYLIICMPWLLQLFEVRSFAPFFSLVMIYILSYTVLHCIIVLGLYIFYHNMQRIFSYICLECLSCFHMQKKDHCYSSELQWDTNVKASITSELQWHSENVTTLSRDWFLG